MADNLKQKEKLIQDLDKNISKLEEALSSMRSSIDEIQKGNGRSPYWNGNNACMILKNACSQYELDQELISKIIDCKGNIKN